MAGKGKPGPNRQFKEKLKFRVAAVVTEKQFADIQEAAKKAGKTASTWVRDLALAELEKKTKKDS